MTPTFSGIFSFLKPKAKLKFLTLDRSRLSSEYSKNSSELIMVLVSPEKIWTMSLRAYPSRRIIKSNVAPAP
jgi:hypothetical protein